MSRKKEDPIYRIDWEDPTGYTRWEQIEAPRTTAKCVTVGFILERGKKYIHAASNKDDGGNVCHVMVIPRVNISRMRRLR